jgi:serine/threonine protein phosphatase PrpC
MVRIRRKQKDAKGEQDVADPVVGPTDQATDGTEEQERDDQGANMVVPSAGSDGTSGPDSDDQPGTVPAEMAPLGEHTLASQANGDLPQERDVIPVTAHATAVTPEKAPDDEAPSSPRIPPPVVLVGNPRLGSDPGNLPRVPGAVPDSVLDGARFPGIVVRAASLRGDDHRHSGDTRQDSIGVWALAPPAGLNGDQPMILACVADGVGSEQLSHLGSAEACRLLRLHAGEQLAAMAGGKDPTQACKQVIAGMASDLSAFAIGQRMEPKQVSTTLLAALVVPRRRDQPGPAADVVLFGVGDSKAFVLREKRWAPIPEAAVGDEAIIRTGTNALPTRPETTLVAPRGLYDGDMLMLCTDGLATPLALNKSVGDQLAEWWSDQPPSLPEFYWQMSFRAQTYGDDRSVVCIWLNGDR